MRTTLDIDPEKLEKVQEITGETSKGKAVDRALDLVIKSTAIERLLAARGTFNLRSPSEWHEQDFELEQQKLRKRKRKGW